MKLWKKISSVAKRLGGKVVIGVATVGAVLAPMAAHADDADAASTYTAAISALAGTLGAVVAAGAALFVIRFAPRIVKAVLRSAS